MLKRFSHSRIINKYSTKVDFQREILDKTKIVDGVPQKVLQNFKIKVAILAPNFENNQDFTEFQIGDKIMFVSKKQTDLPKINDSLTQNSKKYVVKEISDNEDVSDYICYKIRRVVDDC